MEMNAATPTATPDAPPTPAVQQEELERIRAAYARRKRAIPAGRYARIHPGNLCSLHEREQAMAAWLRAPGLESLRGLRILDLGCGPGAALRQLLEYGAEPARLFGVDLLEERVQQAQRLGPHLQWACGNAAQLPFPEASFDLVLQFTLFTSVLNEQVKRAMAGEILRVLAPRGKLLWYDFAYNNPKNADVRGIGRAEIARLFPRCSTKLRRITLAPPLGRLVARISPALYHALALVQPLCTHYLGVLEKP